MRLLIASIYLVLVLGALSMIYPFLIMLAGTTKSGVDAREFRPWPAFLTDDGALYRKHMEGLFNERIDALKITYDRDPASFEHVQPPRDPNARLVQAWRDFLNAWREGKAEAGDASIPYGHAYACGYVDTPISKCVPLHLRAFKESLQDRYGGDLERANLALDSDFVEWHAFVLLPEVALQRAEKPLYSGLAKQFRQYKAALGRRDLYWLTAEGFFKTLYLKMQYTREIREYNARHGTRHASWDQVHLARRLPVPQSGLARRARETRSRIAAIRRQPERTRGDRIRRAGRVLREFLDYASLFARARAINHDWEDFVRRSLSLIWIRADRAAQPLYQEYLRAKYGRIELLQRRYRGDFVKRTSFKGITLEDVWAAFGEEQPDVPDDRRVAREMVLSDWQAFLQGWKDPDTGREYKLPAEMIYLDTVDFRFRDYLTERYGTIEQINVALGTSYQAPIDIFPPQRDAHYLDFRASVGSLRWEFITRNFRTVLDYLVFHGRGVVNTVIYCALSVILALLINPLAAYAMSRYRMPTSYKVLLFLMLTMAFPPMVTQIPAFLMLREFGLLNTFAALVLPAAANGYSIFLLKGFFDSLPRELYESASLDGAGEFRMFWQITMSLSKPILAVIALNAFVFAYSNFMFALLICQDEKMWTLMVWLYQLNQKSGQGVMYAALIIAAIPTLIIFLFCQNIILRGIVVPVEK